MIRPGFTVEVSSLCRPSVRQIIMGSIPSPPAWSAFLPSPTACGSIASVDLAWFVSSLPGKTISVVVIPTPALSALAPTRFVFVPGRGMTCASNPHRSPSGRW